MAIRILNNTECTIESLGLPNVLYDICNLNSGLVLVTGPTGSGKSTTLASMIRFINENRPVTSLQSKIRSNISISR